MGDLPCFGKGSEVVRKLKEIKRLYISTKIAFLNGNFELAAKLFRQAEEALRELENMLGEFGGTIGNLLFDKVQALISHIKDILDKIESRDSTLSNTIESDCFLID